MKEFAKIDYNVQVYFLILGIAVSILLFTVGGFLFFYFIVGIPQLISFLVKAFQKTKKSYRYVVYGIFILPVWFSWIMVFVFEHNKAISDVFGAIILAAFFYSPVLAGVYIYDNYKIYKSFNSTNNENS
ncbi:hypothetical protein PFY12_03890 [Chryseobacterium camelliae]|uniref:Uncharacterized protein n=1 Tax=Chryseobacterium camelliae TaxID=1265445 RepID=A0ABY7QNR9_9FLAO|nr:hypothetical protein [Chryseobacterium camelliae]WBV61267.1 hypothetical protein PFY12_03890 [Chryseobacterium camelliae]